MVELIAKIVDKRAVVSIIGLGYVGLPLAVEFARAGFQVLGLDIDPERIRNISQGRSYIPDLESAELAAQVQAGRLSAAADYRALQRADAIIICVPTPLSKSGDPDISPIIAATEGIARYLHPGMLVVLESTTYPGTTEEVILPKLSSGKLAVGRDFYLAFSPERIDPGNRRFRLRSVPKIVGGMTPQCLEVAQALYQQIMDTVIPVSSTQCAEMVKLLENTFRAVNIALVNEVALMCSRLGLDVWEVIKAASTKPFGFMPFYPGPGLGGHCIPIDPLYLSWKLRTLNYKARFIELASEINSAMPAHIVGKATDALNDEGKPMKGSKILVLGVTYKRDVSDIRESPALDIIRLLWEKGAEVSYHDPYVAGFQLDGQMLEAKELSEESLKEADCVVVVADHTSYNWDWIAQNARLILDARNATASVTNGRARIVKL